MRSKEEDTRPSLGGTGRQQSLLQGRGFWGQLLLMCPLSRVGGLAPVLLA